MSNFTDQLISDSKKAGIRVAATQATKLTKTAIIALLEKQFDADQAKNLAKLLDTEYGTALVGFALGCTLRYAPKVSDHKNAKVLGEEFVISSMATVGNEVISEVLKTIPQLMSILDTIPEKTRVPELEEKIEHEQPTRLDENIQVRKV